MKLAKVINEYIQKQAAYTLTAMLNIENFSTFITIMENCVLKLLSINVSWWLRPLEPEFKFFWIFTVWQFHCSCKFSFLSCSSCFDKLWGCCFSLVSYLVPPAFEFSLKPLFIIIALVHVGFQNVYSEFITWFVRLSFVNPCWQSLFSLFNILEKEILY